MISRDDRDGKDMLLHSNELKQQETYVFLLLDTVNFRLIRIAEHILQKEGKWESAVNASA